MFNKIKETVQSEEFKTVAKQVAIQVATAIVIGVAVQAATYIVIEGSKSLYNGVKDKLTSDTTTEEVVA